MNSLITVFVLLAYGVLIQAQTPEACPYLQNLINDDSVCSEADSELIHKMDLKGKITKNSADPVSSVRFQSDKTITEVDLSDNPDLKKLPLFILDFPNLVSLDISNTGISDFDASICQLKKLKKLIGRNNSYKDNEIPFYTFCLENLEVLDMSDSNIRYIDEYIGKLQSLKEFILINHNLAVLPLMLYELPHLERLEFNTFSTTPSPQLDFISNCKGASQADKQDCKALLFDGLQCEYQREIPYERGEGSFRKIYADMAGFPLEVFESPYNSDLVDDKQNSPEDPRLLLTDQCYILWLGGMDYENESSHLLEKTIGGRTLRELRYIHDLWFEWGRNNIFPMDIVKSVLKLFTSRAVDRDTEGFHFVRKETKNLWPNFLSRMDTKACGFDFSMEDRTKLPFWSLEVYPERYRRMGVSVWVRNLVAPLYKGKSDWWIPNSEEYNCSHIPDFKERVEKIKQKMDSNGW